MLKGVIVYVLVMHLGGPQNAGLTIVVPEGAAVCYQKKAELEQYYLDRNNKPPKIDCVPQGGQRIQKGKFVDLETK